MVVAWPQKALSLGHQKSHYSQITQFFTVVNYHNTRNHLCDYSIKQPETPKISYHVSLVTLVVKLNSFNKTTHD